jgi:hypothetical protein
MKNVEDLAILFIYVVFVVDDDGVLVGHTVLKNFIMVLCGNQKMNCRSFQNM